MTQPPYGTPSGYPPGHPPLPPQKKRPGWGWFVLGGGLIVAAAVVGVALFVWLLASFFEADARVSADDRPYVVSVGTDGDRMLWLASGQSCEVVDTQTYRPIPQEPMDGTLERSDSDGTRYGDSRFDPGSGRLEVTCTGGGTVLVGPAPEVGSFVAGILLTILLPLGLGLLGLVILIVTGVLWAVRPKS